MFYEFSCLAKVLRVGNTVWYQRRSGCTVLQPDLDSPFLKEYRLKHGITLEQLSDGLCSASGLARIEAGARTVGLEEEAALFFRGKRLWMRRQR